MILNVEEMEWNPVTDQQVSGLATMPPKPEGSQFSLDEPLMGGDVSYFADPYGLAFEATWEAWRDDLYGILREMAAELQRASRNRQEVDALSVLNNAFDTAFAGFTNGEALCGAHVGLDGVTRRNRPTVDVEFSVTYLQGAILRFEGQTDERGMPRLMTPTMAVLTPTFKFAAREILGSSGKPFTTDNELNALIQEDLHWMISHYITTATRAFLLAAKGVHDLQFLWRDHPIFDSFDDPWSKNAVFTSYQRHTRGHGTWRGVDGTTGGG